MQHVYHFHATRQLTAGRVEHFDGLVTRRAPIRSIAEYQSIKRQVLTEFQCEDVDNAPLTICSLSLLSTWESEDD